MPGPESQTDLTTAVGQLEVTVEREPGCLIVSLVGEADLATTPQLAGALEEAARGEAGAIVVDLARCAFIDSSGLALLVAAVQKNGNGPSVVLAGARDQVLRALEISGLDQMLPLFESVAEARAAVPVESAGPDAAAV